MYFMHLVAFTLRLEELILFKNLNLSSALLSAMIAIPIFWLFDYIELFLDIQYINYFTILSSAVCGLLYFLIIGVYGISGVPRSVGVLQLMLLFFGVIGSRLAIKYILTSNLKVVTLQIKGMC